MMTMSLSGTLALALCIITLPCLASAFFRGAGTRKRFSPGIPSSRSSRQLQSEISFSEELPKVTVGHKHASLVLECEAHAVLSPTIHWLKNGVRMRQGYSNDVFDDAATVEDRSEQTRESVIRVSSTKSRLFLDCLRGSDQAKYTCVAETPYLKRTQNTTVKVVKRDYEVLTDMEGCMGKRSHRGEPARIFMSTVHKIQSEDTKVQLFCRAQGHPAPSITWFDRNNEPIVDGEEYQVLDNGDLIINSISWFKHMGVYTCAADNDAGTDTSTSFLYPAARDY